MARLLPGASAVQGTTDGERGKFRYFGTTVTERNYIDGTTLDIQLLPVSCLTYPVLKYTELCIVVPVTLYRCESWSRP
jgi:hypothetical protein